MTRLDCFVTGTDTGIGKTHASATLLRALRACGLSSVGMKPVASGCEWRDGHWRNDDVAQLRAASSVSVPLEQTCPFLLRKPCSPHLAAAHEGVRITRSPIRAAFNAMARRADAVVVEGVGGFHVPLDAGAVRWSTADLAVMLNLPVIVVVGIRLGCLNHTMLTAEAIRARSLKLAGWIANRIDPDMLLPDESISTLCDTLDAPCLGELPWGLEPADAAVRLDLTPLMAAAASIRRHPAPLSLAA